MEEAIKRIERELEERLFYFKENDKLIEHQRINERTKYDLEMMKETGFTRGIENYSRHISLRKENETPTTLIDYFGKNFIMIIDESHVTLPQVRGMYNGDQARKKVLIDYGFRLPSALDNRPLKFDEFEGKLDKIIYVSATPSEYEIDKSKPEIIEQIIRPTGLLDPTIEIKPTENQIDVLIEEIIKRREKNQRTIITTLTIRMSEELTDYLKKQGIKVAYLHSEIKTLERLQLLRN